jgi:gas vesicle structural protein
MAIQQSHLTRTPRPSNLAEVLDLILDKGLVIDAYIRVSAIGIEVLTVDLRVVVASVDTYLRFAEAVNRLDLEATENAMTLEDLQRGGKARREMAESGTEGALEGVKDFFTKSGSGDEESSGDGRRRR